MNSPQWRRWWLFLGLLYVSRCTSWSAAPAPSVVQIEAGDAAATVRWAPVAGATGYRVKRAASAISEATIAASNVVELHFTDTNVVNGRPYFYSVSTLRNASEGPDSDRLRVAPSAPVLDLLPAGAKVEKFAGSFQFTEGPAWMSQEGGSLIFSDINANRLIRWNPIDGPVTFRQPSGQANGNTVDLQGRLVTCEHLNRRVSRTEPDGTVTPLVTEYRGKRFNAPNDVVVKSNGTVWFTDPNYGAGQLQPGRFVYRFEPADGNGTVTLVATNFDQPNGLAFSPDESRLYVADSGAPHHVKVFDVLPDQSLANVRVFAVISPGNPDGIRCDSGGRLFVTAGDGVQIFSPEGTLLGKLRTPEVAANVGFGGPTRDWVFITANMGLYGVSRTPDLVVTAITRYPAVPVEGGEVRFLVTVKNQGTGSTVAGAPFRVALSIDSLTNILTTPRFDAPLPPDASVLLPCEVGDNGSVWKASVGSHAVRAEVDDLRAIAESNERNNSLQVTVNVSAPPPDSDGDGLADADETVAGTSPTDANSVFRVLSVVEEPGGDVSIEWSSLEGKTYAIASKEDPRDLKWFTLPGVISATGMTTRWTHSRDPLYSGPVYFRVQVLP